MTLRQSLEDLLLNHGRLGVDWHLAHGVLAHGVLALRHLHAHRGAGHWAPHHVGLKIAVHDDGDVRED